jgi:primosomal protein N' (replication factor Y)
MTLQNLKYLRIALSTPLRRLFDYLPSNSEACSHLTPGCRVKVPFGRRTLVGIFIEMAETTTVPQNKLKPIIEILDQESLIPQDLMQLGLWAAEYYHHPVGEVLAHFLPTLLRQGKSEKNFKTERPLDAISKHLTLNVEQAFAVEKIRENKNSFNVFLLHGITGSGKTEVYLQAMIDAIAAHKQILVMVPEIGLTPQALQRFSERFKVVSIALHSGQTPRQRLNAWRLIKDGTARIIIGTRSAVFSPFLELGLIIIDEEHDLSFKQQDGFRYHARDLAILRAQHYKIPIILGSATPSAETLYKAYSGKFHLLSLTQRAGAATLPNYQIIDIRNQKLEEGISKDLISAMQTELAAGQQVMLFLNRRGFAPVVLCHSCGWIIPCRRCDMRMTYHQHSKRMQCHHCEMQKILPVSCEACGANDLLPVGLGTERLESVLQKHFPTVSIARIDRDTTQRKGSMNELLEGIIAEKYQILIGTQMLAKGHHFPNVTLVGIVDADGGFFSSDFRGIERMGQLLIQVAGRAGRVQKQGNVCIQTHYPDHPIFHQLLSADYQAFVQMLLEERQAANFPPYSHLALFRAEGFSETQALNFLKNVKNLAGQPAGISLAGPILAPMPRRAGKHRAQLLVQTQSRNNLQRLLQKIISAIDTIPDKPKIRWSIDVDPMEMF